MLRDVVFVVVGRMRPRFMQVAMLTMKKSGLVFYFYACMCFSSIVMVLCLPTVWALGALDLCMAVSFFLEIQQR